MPETSTPTPAAEMDRLLDLAQSRLSACPAAVRSDLAACIGYLRVMHATGDRSEASMAGLDRHHARAITLESKGLDRHEDRALSMMVMAISALRNNTDASNAQADRTLRQIRLAQDDRP